MSQSTSDNPSNPGLELLETDSPEQHFRTDHLLTNLKGRAISGGLVTAAAQAVRFGLYSISVVVLSRLLSPADFGLVAMVGTLTSFLRMFREAGLSTATVQQDKISHAQVSNLFWINVLLGVAAAAAGVALSPVVAWWFHRGELIKITVILSLTFILSGSAVQHIALLNRQMRFKAAAAVDVGSMTLSLVVGTVMALRGWGYWSLVGSQVALSVGELVMAWTMSGWRPQLPKAKVQTRSMIHFGASLTFSSLVRKIAGGSDSILIGRFFGDVPLGVYSRGLALLMRPLDQFLIPFDTVFVPVLSRLQDQPERYRKTFLQIYDAMVLVSFLFAGLLLGLSRPIVLVLLGHKWEEVVPVFAALTIAAAYYAAAGASQWLLTTQGRNRDIIKTGLVISGVSVVSYAIGLVWGVTGVALAFSVGGLFVRLPVQFHIVGRSGPVLTADLWRMLLRHLPLWIIGAGAAYGGTLATARLAMIVQLLAGVVAGSAACLVVVLILPYQRQTMRNVMQESSRFLAKLRGKKAE